MRDLDNFMKLPDPALCDSDGDLIEPIQHEQKSLHLYISNNIA